MTHVTFPLPHCLLFIMFYNFGAICNQPPPLKERKKERKHLVYSSLIIIAASLAAQLVKNLPAMQESLVRFLGQKDMLEKG